MRKEPNASPDERVCAEEMAQTVAAGLRVLAEFRAAYEAAQAAGLPPAATAARLLRTRLRLAD